jgi:hypothetical protein
MCAFFEWIYNGHISESDLLFGVLGACRCWYRRGVLTRRLRRVRTAGGPGCERGAGRCQERTQKEQEQTRRCAASEWELLTSFCFVFGPTRPPGFDMRCTHARTTKPLLE